MLSACSNWAAALGVRVGEYPGLQDGASATQPEAHEILVLVPGLMQQIELGPPPVLTRNRDLDHATPGALGEVTYFKHIG
jgi:hypothetical protein